jgi:hypothetical protein
MHGLFNGLNLSWDCLQQQQQQQQQRKKRRVEPPPSSISNSNSFVSSPVQCSAVSENGKRLNRQSAAMHFLALLTALLSVTSPSLVAAEEEIPIGTILSQWDDYREVFTAMQFALEQQHNKSNKLFHFKLYADNIKTVDAYKLTRIICRQVKLGKTMFFSQNE